MLNLIKENAGWIALIIIAILFVSGMFGAHSNSLGSTSCGSITCLSGGLRLVSDAGGDFESDVAAVFASTMNITGLLTTGNGGIKIGASGTTMTQVLNGTCSLSSSAFTVTATSTAIFSCAVTGVAANDRTFVQFPATTTPAGMGWVVIGSLASTTASNSIEVRVANMSGATAVIPNTIASTTEYYVVR